MLERVLSLRSRTSQPTDEEDEDDESKNRKNVTFARRATKQMTKLGVLWPCLFLFSLILTSFAFHSRNILCISPTNSYFSRINFFGIEGLDSDFGSLGVPWCRAKLGKTVEWTSKDLIKGLEEFVPIYETRPIKNNMYGMGFDHSFGLWFMARWLKPDLMIESGAFKGHSTWVLRQAMPETRILSITPRHPEKYLKKGPAYVDRNCTYFAGKDFVDFGSIDWKTVLKKHGVSDMNRVLVFFDDHQNELKRLKQALNVGFRHLVFEDNYDTGTGDHYSLRQICDQFYIRDVLVSFEWENGLGFVCALLTLDSASTSNHFRTFTKHVTWVIVKSTNRQRGYLPASWYNDGGGHSCFKDGDEARIRMKRNKFWEKAVDIDELCGGGETWWGVRGQMRDDFNHSNKAISHAQHFQNSRFVESILDVYWELSPVAGPSLTHQTRYDPARAPSPIVEDGRFGLFRRLGLARLDTSVFNGYTQMVYLQISK